MMTGLMEELEVDEMTDCCCVVVLSDWIGELDD